MILSSFGILKLSIYPPWKKIFNPYELRPEYNIKMLPTMVTEGEFSSAIALALSLNLSASVFRQLLNKIPHNCIQSILVELELSQKEQLLNKIC